MYLFYVLYMGDVPERLSQRLTMSGWYVKPFSTRLQNEELHRKYFDAQVGQANFKQVKIRRVQIHGMRKDGLRHPGGFVWK